MVEYWGSETQKAVENFPVSGERVPASVIRWLGRIKSAAATANAELGMLDGEIARRVAAAADEIGAGQHGDQFPVDIFQTGSGTSTNMNVNEVIAHLAGNGVHANDHVNLGQSSNDVFPTAVHLAALEMATTSLIPSLRSLHESLAAKSIEFADLAKAGRTHLMDAVPITLGQEFGAFAQQMQLGIERVEGSIARVSAVPLGGTAVGSGLNTHPDFARRVLELLVRRTGIEAVEPVDRFEAQASRDALVELSGVLKVIAVSLTKIANDIALLASGPRAGLGEITLPELQKGSSIMPGKVNPVLAEVVLQVAAQVIGNDTAITIGGMQGNFQLNVRVPLIARNLLGSMQILATATSLFSERCVAGIGANTARLAWLADNTLASATVLNPIVGYDAATEIVRRAQDDQISLVDAAREFGLDDALIEDRLNSRRIARGNQVD
ncbi:class II fumarate hydratase [Ilumatobacter sp.]|uniref:class II fumarate hydratase n=1 Tax=Ilumatobacter sp. TaxID=1967498 RepID=UPI003752DAB6